MANSHEPSYYEIALTNRQVVVAFVILLICILCAFFSGVYIGREGTLRDQEQIVRATPPPQAPANDEGRELEEFEFFDSSGSRPEAPAQQAQAEEPPPSPSEDTTLLEDFGGEEDLEAVPEDDVEVEEAPVEEPAPRPNRNNRRERREQEERAAVEAARKAASARQETPAPARPTRISDAAATPASSRAGKVVIQVFSSAEKSQAERIRQRLVNGGHPAFLSPVQVGGSTMYRVRIGPYGTRADAQKVADQVRKDQKLDTWITE